MEETIAVCCRQPPTVHGRDEGGRRSLTGPAKASTYLVRAAAGGAIYKIAITSYYAATDGGMSATSARFIVKYAAL